MANALDRFDLTPPKPNPVTGRTPTGDPPPRSGAPRSRIVEEAGVQSFRGEKPTKKLYRGGDRIA